jgi:hypothetical protein
MKQQQLQ